MTVKQIYSLINSMASQMWGDSAITANDYRGVISMGESVLATNTSKEQFLGVLADRIGATILRTLDLELDFPNLLRNSFEWGAIIQKINIQPFSAQAQKAWNVGDNDFTPNQFDVDKPTVTQTFFKDANAWEFHVTIPDQMLKTAFTSAEAFGAFVDGIMSALSDSMIMALNNMSYGCISNFIAEKVQAGNGVINALQDYNEQFSKSYTSLAEAVLDKEFCRYVDMIMKNAIKYMSKPSKLYNTGGMVRATARDNAHILISSDFATASEVYLQADTYWKDLVALPGYKEFVSLQGTGNDGMPNISENTKISVIPASNAANNNNNVIVNGVIAIIADREAFGIGYDDRFTAVDRNNRNRYSNYTSGATLQYFNDLSENGIVIIANNEGLSVDKTSLTFANSSAADQTITATTSPAGETVTWKSSKTSVATVSGGVVSAAGTGSCNITAEVTINGIKYTKVIPVTVG